MVDDAVELVRLRNNFYRNNYRRLVGFLMILLVIVGALVATVFYQIVNRPEPKYFATTVDGRITPLFSLSEAMLSQSEILQWARSTAIAAYTYSFVNYHDAMQELQGQFTHDGWKYYINALKVNKIFEVVASKKLVVSANTTGAPIILSQDIIKNKYSWKVQIPLLVTYQSPTEQIRQAVLVTMVISRVPTVDAPKGIAIVNFAIK